MARVFLHVIFLTCILVLLHFFQHVKNFNFATVCAKKLQIFQKVKIVRHTYPFLLGD